MRRALLLVFVAALLAAAVTDQVKIIRYQSGTWSEISPLIKGR